MKNIIKRLDELLSLIDNVNDCLAVLHDREEQDEYRIVCIKDYKWLIPDCISLLTDAFAGEDSNNPIVNCFKSDENLRLSEYRQSCEFYFKILFGKLERTGKLYYTFGLINYRNEELVAVAVCDDLNDPNMDLNMNELVPVSHFIRARMPVAGMLQELINVGYKKFWKEQIKDQKVTKNEQNKLNMVFHVNYRGTKAKYNGKGLTSKMYQFIINFAKDHKFKYIFHETTNNITSKMAHKYGKAKTYHTMDLKDGFPTASSKDKIELKVVELSQL